MRRPRHKLEVSTFPFLAVLLCAMGAMVLFLLIMDRRGKIVAKTKAREALEERVAARGMDDAARLAEWERQREALHQALLDQHSELHGERGEVRQLLVESRQKLHAKQTEREKLHQATALANAKLLQRKAELTEQQIGFQKSAEKETVARSELVRLGADVLDLEKALADLKALKKRERQTFSLVPYRGKRGDNRNPIYIECAADGLIFHPERKAISRAELNPTQLRSEVERRAGRLEREEKKGKETQEPAPPRGPYVLFLIRPDGITNYYQALAFLKGYQIDFGYEVVDQHWVLDFNAPVALAGASPWKAGPGAPAKSTKPPAVAAPSPRSYPAPLSSDSNLRVGSSPVGGLPPSIPSPLGTSGPGSGTAPGAPAKSTLPGTPGTNLPGVGVAGPVGPLNSVPGLGGFGARGPNGGPAGIGTPGLPVASAGEPPGPRPIGPPSAASPFQDVSRGGAGGGQPNGNDDGGVPRMLPIGRIPPPVSLVKAGPGLPIGGVAAMPRPISSAVGLVGSPVVPGAPSGNMGGMAGTPGQLGGAGYGGAGQGTGYGTGSPGQSPGATAGMPGQGTLAAPGQIAGAATGLPGQGTSGAAGTPGQGTSGAAGTPGQNAGAAPGTPGQGTGDAVGQGPGGAAGQGPGGGTGSPGQGGGGEAGAPGQAAGAQAGLPGQGSPAAPGTPGSIPNVTVGTPGQNPSVPPPTAPGATGAPAAGQGTFPGSGSGSDSGSSSDASNIPPVLRPPSYGPALPAGANNNNPRPATPPLGVVLGNRDFVITITCYSDHVTVFPGGKQHWWKGPNAVQSDATVVQNVQGLIAGRQRSVRAGEPPYRPLIRFQLAPDGLSSFLRVYPRLVSLKVPMTRENLED